jgi:hypothetical protein
MAYNHKEYQKKYQKEYCKTEKYKQSHKRYQQSEKGKTVQKTALKKYRQSEKGKNKKKELRMGYKKILIRLKQNGCSICGYNECQDALDFHHANPNDKKFNLCVDGIERKDDLIIDELNKCILLCKNCHAKIHNSEVKIYDK